MYSFLCSTPQEQDGCSSSFYATLSLAHINLWMWRLFLDDIGAFRASLALPPCPFSAPDRDDLPSPKSTPLLVGVSSYLVPVEPSWPSNAIMTGFWLPPPSRGASLPPSLACVLASCPQVLFVTLGSMEGLGLVSDALAHALIHAVVIATRTCGWTAIVQHDTSGPLARALAAHSHNPERLSAISGHLDYTLLLPQCRAVLHHGGAGTVSTRTYQYIHALPTPAPPSLLSRKFTSLHALNLGGSLHSSLLPPDHPAPPIRPGLSHQH